MDNIGLLSRAAVASLPWAWFAPKIDILIAGQAACLWHGEKRSR
jgi:hypothetical protein